MLEKCAPKIKDATPLTPEQSTRLEENFDLIKEVIYSMRTTHPTLVYEDVYDHVLNALIQCSRRFDVGLASFRTFASTRLRWSIIDYFRHISGIRSGCLPATRIHFFSLEAYTDRSRGTGPCERREMDLGTEGLVKSPQDVAEDEENCETIFRLIPAGKLRKLALMLLDRLPMAECGNIMGVSESRISQLAKDIRNTLITHSPEDKERLIKRIASSPMVMSTSPCMQAKRDAGVMRRTG